MIAAILGNRSDIQGNKLFLQTHAGIVYETIATVKLIEAISETNAKILIPTQVIYRETDQTIYAFEDLREKEAFNILVQASGISGKSAMVILDSIESVPGLYEAIADSDSSFLIKIKGIGKNKAKVIIDDLKAKVSKLIDQPANQR